MAFDPLNLLRPVAAASTALTGTGALPPPPVAQVRTAEEMGLTLAPLALPAAAISQEESDRVYKIFNEGNAFLAEHGYTRETIRETNTTMGALCGANAIACQATQEWFNGGVTDAGYELFNRLRNDVRFSLFNQVIDISGPRRADGGLTPVRYDNVYADLSYQLQNPVEIRYPGAPVPAQSPQEADRLMQRIDDFIDSAQSAASTLVPWRIIQGKPVYPQNMVEACTEFDVNLLCNAHGRAVLNGLTGLTPEQAQPYYDHFRDRLNTKTGNGSYRYQSARDLLSKSGIPGQVGISADNLYGPLAAIIEAVDARRHAEVEAGPLMAALPEPTAEQQEAWRTVTTRSAEIPAGARNAGVRSEEELAEQNRRHIQRERAAQLG